MKVLIYNSTIDIRPHFKKAKIDIEVEYRTDHTVFPFFKAYEAIDENNNKVNIYSPLVLPYLRNKIEPFQYHAVLFGWNPNDYPNELRNTGGYATYEPLYLGTRVATFRNDGNAFMYIVHELKHLMCYSLTERGTYVQDEMDVTIVNGAIKPYWKNQYPEDPDSNHQRTLRHIAPYASNLGQFPPVLRQDMVGDWVWALQWLLNVNGATLFIDGKFGKKTDMAVRVFQTSRGLTIDGKIGIQSVKALHRI